MLEWILVEMFHSYLQREKAIPKEHLKLDKELNFLHFAWNLWNTETDNCWFHSTYGFSNKIWHNIL